MPTLTISQAELVTLERFNQSIGGVGKVYGPYNPGKNVLTKKSMYALRTSGFKPTQATIAMLWKWLSPTKRAQAKKVLNTYLLDYTTRPKLKHGPKKKEAIID